MPVSTFIEPNPNFTPKTPADKAAYAAIMELHEARGPIKIDSSGLVEAVQNSRGMYRQKEEAAPAVTATIAAKQLADFNVTELKIMATTMGLDVTRKQRMTKEELVGLVQSRLDAVEIVDDEEAS